MAFKPGTRLRSQVDSTEVIVIRSPSIDLALQCGGVDLVPLDARVPEGLTPRQGWDGGTQLGKRYTAAQDSSLELLVTQAGPGTLSADDVPLIAKPARALPSSD